MKTLHPVLLRTPEPASSPAVLSRRRALVAGGGVAASSILAACGLSADPFAQEPQAAGVTGPIVIGSQQYYSNEIIAELYAQVIEAVGLTVEREYQIGQRDVYLPDLASGRINVLPEYGGNLLQFYDAATTAHDTESIMKALLTALPESVTVLDPAQASDQDAFVVTRASAETYQLSTISDLASLGRAVTIAANSELEARPYGPDGLSSVYGVTATVVPTEDSGGPLTVKALLDGSVDVANIYTASPAIIDNDLVVLEDPENLILPQNVVPVVSATLGAKAVQAINRVQAVLSMEDLQALNARSTGEQLGSAEIARDWLVSKGLLD